jgi:hypothetical protein
MNNLLFNYDGDFITFERTVDTAPNQINIMPGYLQKKEVQRKTVYHRRQFQKITL